MMGPEKLSTIKSKLRASVGKSDAELMAWFNRQVSDERRKPEVSQTAIETLFLLRDALLNETKRKPRAKSKKRNTASKK